MVHWTLNKKLKLKFKVLNGNLVNPEEFVEVTKQMIVPNRFVADDMTLAA
jgi:hypothetical protein